MYTLGDIAERMGLSYRGDPQRQLGRLSMLAAAGPEDLSFLANRKYAAQLADTRAGAVILQEEFVDQCPVDCLVADNPYLVFARLTALFDDRPEPEPGVHAGNGQLPRPAGKHPLAGGGRKNRVLPADVQHRGDL